MTLFKSSGLVWWAMWFWMLDVFADTPTGNHGGPPSTSFRARSVLTPPGFGNARLATLAFAPLTPEGSGRREEEQITETVLHQRLFFYKT